MSCQTHCVVSNYLEILRYAQNDIGQKLCFRHNFALDKANIVPVACFVPFLTARRKPHFVGGFAVTLWKKSAGFLELKRFKMTLSRVVSNEVRHLNNVISLPFWEV